MSISQIFQEKSNSAVLGLGTWVFGGKSWGGFNKEENIDVVKEAINQGINFIDTAPIYSDGVSEEIVGIGLKGQRHKAFIATKCGLIRENGRVAHNLSKKSILTECDASLKRLQCDVIDLYQTHRPDPKVEIEETMATLLLLQQQKKIKHIGLCNITVDLLKRALKEAPVLTIQMEYSLLQREIEKDIVPFCMKEKIKVIAYGVLGGGILTGKYKNPPTFPASDARRMFYPFYEKERFLKIKELLKIMKKIGHPLNEIALNWCRQQEGISVTLVGCRNIKQLKENIHALTWDLTQQELLLEYV